MAAKEESVILKYLKKNPGSEALDISFGTDIDESVVKETLQQLLGKQQVSEAVSESGISTWSIAAPPPPAPKVAAPKPQPAPKPVSEDAPTDDSDDSDSDEGSSSKGGVGKGFVIFIALLFAAIGAGASFFMVQGSISAAKADIVKAKGELQDSVGVFKLATNNRISAMEQEIKLLKAPPAEEKADDAKAAKKATKPVVKKGKKGK
ncbi:MAG TPA: hypothetical protein PKO15_05105 [Fibrobacteria bacterium]|nr:hypothetical protein [Fibrobacteria bacterium]HOX53240.1 hypothetical protein [Fibrobacteria bacterium]